MGTKLKTLLGALGAALVLAPAAQAAEPNNDFATATGPLTAGQTFKAALETADDSDFQFFYVPDPATVTVTTINDAKSEGKAANRGRTIVSSLLRARKGKLPQPIAEKTLKPGQKTKVKVTLLPGKYFIPIGHAQTSSPPLGDIPFRIQIAPTGVTTDSYELFQRRCQAAHRKVQRIKSSIKRTSKRIARAKKHDASTHKIVKLKIKLREKRAKAKPAKKAEKFACSIPQ